MSWILRIFTLVGLVGLVYGEWSPSDCPHGCICHQIWSKQISKKLNAVDCQDRDIVILGNVPKNTEALLLKGNQLHVENLNRQNLTDIQYLDLSANRLKLHQVEALQTLFIQLQSLRVLEISNNYLESLQASFFIDLKSLEYLSLSGNSILYIERNTFQSLTKLKTLKLNNNRLAAINEHWFGNGNSALRLLDFSSNAITSIQSSDLVYLRSLELLNLARNNLTFMKDNSFLGSGIRELYLNDNALRRLSKTIVKSLTQLSILNMDNNPIKSLDSLWIANHSSIKQISFRNMPKLRVVYESAFTNLSQLIKVDLSQNRLLEYIHPQAFVNCERVEILHLHTNVLRGLDEEILSSLPALRESSLYNNPVHCSCLAKWLKNTSVSFLDADKIVCASPHAVHLATLYQLSDKQLDTDCAPLVLPISEPTVSVEYGANVELECQALGTNTISWEVPKSHVRNESTTPTKDKFIIPMANHEDHGLYTCIATSDTGESDSASIDVRIIHNKILLSTVAIGKSFIVLKWDSTGDAAVISYTSAVDGVQRDINMAAGITQYTLSNLKPNNGYSVCLLYHSRRERTCITIHMLAPSRTDTASADNSETSKLSNAAHKTTQAILITFATIGVVVTLAIIISIVYKKCSRHKSSKVLYLRQMNENHLIESSVHVKMEQCYNPTTVPLCENELT